MKKVVIVLMCLVLLTGCSFSAKKLKDKSTNQDTKEYISDSEINEIIKNNDYIIVDVRTPLEYEEEHIVDAINIPYDVITNSSLDKNKVVLLYCKSGKRASIAYQTLHDLGYQVYNMGGIADINLPKDTKK